MFAGKDCEIQKQKNKKHSKPLAEPFSAIPFFIKLTITCEQVIKLNKS